MCPRLTRILAAGALAAALAPATLSSSQAAPLPVTSAQAIAGSAPTEHVQWWGGWGGYGWGWRRPYYGGGALAAGLVGGLALGALADAGSYYGYGGYPYYGYGYEPSYYAYPSAYYGTSYYGTSYGWGYGNAYWASGKRVHKHGRKHAHR